MTSLHDARVELPRGDVAALLRMQGGVISGPQARAAGESVDDIVRRLRRREWARVVPGVFVEHTGPLTFHQRAWVGVLALWPAAVGGRAALRLAAGPGWRGFSEHDPVDLVVSRARHLVTPPGYRVTRRSGFPELALWNLGPPRLRAEEAALDVALRGERDWEVVSILAEVCQRRATTATRLRHSLAGRARVGRRAWLDAVLADLESGSSSVLEQEYLSRVERAHGLPRGVRQARELSATGVSRFRDVEYAEWGVVVELDGYLFHASADRFDEDLERDLEVAVSGRRSLRLGWGQVAGRSCLTASRIGTVLSQAGWPGRVHPCGPACGLLRAA